MTQFIYKRLAQDTGKCEAYALLDPHGNYFARLIFKPYGKNNKVRCYLHVLGTCMVEGRDANGNKEKALLRASEQLRPELERVPEFLTAIHTFKDCLGNDLKSEGINWFDALQRANLKIINVLVG